MAYRITRLLGRRAAQLLALVFATSTLLFFLLQASGDPARLMAGEMASEEQVESITERYGFDDPILVQYGRFVAGAVVLDFNVSLQSGQPAMGLVLDRLALTVLLAAGAICLNALVSVPVGTWLGAAPNRRPQQLAALGVFVAQGVPGYVIGLLGIQIFAVQLGLLPVVGASTVRHWVLPTATLAAFLASKLIRVVASNVSEGMGADYVRLARSMGTPEVALVVRHVLPNSLLGSVALLGTQFAILLSGSVITEVIFSWPGIGSLLVDAVRQLDFPVVQASVFVIAILVFAANAATDVIIQLVDPRLRRQAA